MAVTKRALEDDHCETSPQAKKIATTAPSENADSKEIAPTAPSETADSGEIATTPPSETTISEKIAITAPPKTTDAKKISTTTPSETATSEDERVQPYLDRIAELESLIGEYEAFVDREGLFLDLPTSLESIVDSRPKAAAKLASILKRNIYKAYQKLDDADGPDITNDDYADELVYFLPDVKRLSKLQDGPRLAWEVLLLLVDKSHGDDLGNGYNCGGYNCNEPGSPYFLLDETMLEVAKARWGGLEVNMGKESQDMLQDSVHLASVATEFYDYGILKYLEGTIVFLDKILMLIYPDEADVEDEGDADEGDAKEGHVEEVHQEEDDAKVVTAKEDEYRDKGIGHEAISHFLNRETGEPLVEGVQFGDGILSMP
ncbi:hypothetical protein MMC18_004294 [Xylographa bjoerkii]|nr:hypothetical protein [Xylographa bjoerkii]